MPIHKKTARTLKRVAKRGTRPIRRAAKKGIRTLKRLSPFRTVRRALKKPRPRR